MNEQDERNAEVMTWADGALGFIIESEQGVRKYTPTRAGMGLRRNASDAEAALWDALVSARRDA